MNILQGQPIWRVFVLSGFAPIDIYQQGKQPQRKYLLRKATMTTYIETKEEFNNSDKSLNWEIQNPTDLAGLEYGSDEETEALDSLLTAFQNENNVVLDWEARNAWEEVARDFYNTNS